jgi:serine/threonine protein kinase
MAIQIGDILGDYQVTGILGRGGMGKVYRVRSLITDREEAMKIVLPDLDEDPGLADRFLREIKVHASLQHPNIAALHTALRIGDRLVMILELVEGASLEDALRRGPLDISTAIQFITQILAALSFAHERGVIHRDIKPANILIADGNVAKLTDFGIARATGGPRLTGTGLAVGTLAYMAPEQILSGHADARSDIYSLGLMCYEMVTGRRPIQGDTEHALMNAQLSVVPPDPAAVNPQVPPAVSAAIMRSLAKEPVQRFQTAREFLAALQQDPAKASSPPPSTPSAAGTFTPELADLEARLSRVIGPIARRLVADAARRYGTVAEIRQALAEQIEDSKERQAFLRTSPSGAVTVTMASPTPAPVLFDPATLDRLTRALAAYIGPVAKVVVTNAARKARSADDLQNALAGEVPAADRQRFLAAVRGAL